MEFVKLRSVKLNYDAFNLEEVRVARAIVKGDPFQNWKRHSFFLYVLGYDFDAFDNQGGAICVDLRHGRAFHVSVSLQRGEVFTAREKYQGPAFAGWVYKHIGHLNNVYASGKTNLSPGEELYYSGKSEKDFPEFCTGVGGLKFIPISDAAPPRYKVETLPPWEWMNID